MVSVLFVCLANICRSPAAEGLLRHAVQKETLPIEISVESCGISNWSVGQLPDERMRLAAAERGVILTSRSQQFKTSFYDRHDYILAVDNEVLQLLKRHAHKPEHTAKIYLISEFSKIYHGQEVSDPYRGGDEAFDNVLDMLEDCCNGLITHIRNQK